MKGEAVDDAIADGKHATKFGADIEYDRKLVTTQSGDEMASAQAGLDPTADLPEQVISGGVSAGIVDRLETIGVEHAVRNRIVWQQ